MYSVLLTPQTITNFSLLMNWFMYTIFNAKIAWNYLPNSKTYILNLCDWCLFMMQSEKAKLISCFGNAYCIPTTFFKTISKLKLKTLFLIFTQRELCKLWSCFFQTAPFKRKKVRYNPLRFIIVCLSLCLSISLSLCCRRQFFVVRSAALYCCLSLCLCQFSSCM
jgi:hypothetical protein